MSDYDLANELSRQDDPDTSVLMLLSHSSDTLARKVIATIPKTPVEALVRLLKDDDVYVACMVTRRRVIHDELVPLIVKHKSSIVRTEATTNSAMPPILLTMLSNDPDQNVREALLSNPSTPEEVIRKLHRGGFSKTGMERLATNQEAPPDLLAEVAEHGSDFARSCLMMNKNTPEETLLALIAQASHSQLKDMTNRSHLTEPVTRAIVERLEGNDLHRLASNPNCPPVILDEFAKSNNAMLRSFVAGNDGVSRSTLWLLANDKSHEVRMHVAITTEDFDILEHLAGDTHYNVRYEVANHMDAPLDLLRVLIRDENWDVQNAAEDNLQARFR